VIVDVREGKGQSARQAGVPLMIISSKLELEDPEECIHPELRSVNRII